MNNAHDRIEKIKKDGYPFDFSKTFNHAIEIFKKIVMPAGLAMMLFSLILCAIIFMYIFTSADWQSLGDDMKNFDIRNFSVQGMIMYIVSMMLITSLAVPLAAGVMQMCRQADLGQQPTLQHAFQYYTGHYFTDLFFVGILLTSVTVLLGTVLEYVGIPVIGTLISIIFGLLSVLAPAMVVFGNLRPLAAIQASFVVVGKEVLMIFLLILISYFIAFAGILACCVGMFFTLPFVYVVHYSIYKHSVGFEESAQKNDDIEA